MVEDNSPPESRSPKWSKARIEHLKVEPTCRVCGATTKLEVHHVEPFHKRPDLELDPKNLVTLCGNPSCKSHLTIGHLGDYQLANPDVRSDADMLRKRRETVRNRKP